GLLGRKTFLDQRLYWNVNNFCAFLADTPDQSLSADQMHRGRNQEGLNAHVHETGNRFGSAVGVQSRKYQVARERSLDRDLRGFEVSNFADQDDVGVLPQKRAQCGRKVQTDLFFHLNLIDAAQLKLDRIFGRHDVRVWLIQARDGRVERVGFS